MSIQIKKKSKFYRILENNELADHLLFSFLIHDLSRILCLDKIIAHLILGRIRYHANSIIISFKRAFKQVMPLHKTLNIFQPVVTKTHKGELKIDLPIYISINLLKKQTVFAFSYSYNINRNNKKQKHLWTGQFEVISDGSVQGVWLYKEKHDDSYLPTYCSEVTNLQEKDTLCVSIPICMMGRIVSDLLFYPIEVKEQRTMKKQGSLTRAGFRKTGNINKSCKIQQIYEWRNLESIKEQDSEIKKIISHYISQNMVLLHLSKSNVESYYRIELMCKQKGRIQGICGLNKINVSNQNESLVINLKKKGAYLDPKSIINLRVKGKVIIYLVRI